MTPEDDFEEPEDKNCDKCGSSYSLLETFIHYIKEEKGYVGQDPGYCPVCVNSNGYEHTGKKNLKIVEIYMTQEIICMK